jgi:hypothetical protein
VLVDAEYGGKHLDVSLDVNETRVRARIPAGESGGWARSLKAGDALALSFHPADVRLFADGDAPAAAVSAPDELDSPASVAV